MKDDKINTGCFCLDRVLHSALKLEKNCNFKSTKTHFLQFQKWQKKKKKKNQFFAPENSLKLPKLQF